MTQDNFELEARLEEAIESALEVFWSSIVASFPEATSGDFDPMYEGVMTLEATNWVRHWLLVNALSCEQCGAIVSQEKACYEMAKVSCEQCFAKTFPPTEQEWSNAIR